MYPNAGVILDSNGNLFGTTVEGGLYGFGTVFELIYNINSGWTETVLYNFQNLSDGQWPYAGLVSDSAGNLYGATSDGGAGGGGTLFELSSVGDSWTFTLLYSFSGQQGKYCGPRASLSMDNSGSLYGTTLCDGANNLGNVFKLANIQNGWEYTSLYDFIGGPDGAGPVSNVTFDTNNNLFGTAGTGGNGSCNPPHGCGTVWMIKP
ncbi:MAG: choice-of-anchor tandem repeat GloVer-containing protein [Candidatus Korobacteraceae bacterium]